MTDPVVVHGAVRDSAYHVALPAHAHSFGDVAHIEPPPATDYSAADAVGVEVSRAASDASLPGVICDSVVAANPATDASASAVQSTDTAESIVTIVCRECDSDDSSDLRVCVGCNIAVHTRCYGDSIVSIDASPPASSTNEQPPAAQLQQQQTVTNETTANDVSDTITWTCDCCLEHVANVDALQCVFCDQLAGDRVMKRVDTSAWRFQPPPSTTTATKNATTFAHVLCSRWDPYTFEYVPAPPTSVAAASKDAAAAAHRIKPAPVPQLPTRSTRSHESDLRTHDAAPAATPEPPPQSLPAPLPPSPSPTPPTAPPTLPPSSTLDVFNYALSAPSSPCCFCASSSGVRIQCYRINCGQCFHVLCAHRSSNGLVAIRSPPVGQLVEYHAYCNRHGGTETPFVNAHSLLQLLLSPAVVAVTGRETMVRLEAVQRRLDVHAIGSYHAFVKAVAPKLVGLYKRGLKASKTIPPTPQLRHLQVLQLFIGTLPQLRVVYRIAPSTPRVQLGDNLEMSDALYTLLQQTFDPKRLVAKYAGALHELEKCAVCRTPFQQRQHVLYCTHATTPHAQHWGCTTRHHLKAPVAVDDDGASAQDALSAAAASCSTKNTLALVVRGQWRDVELPMRLAGVSVADDVVCGKCDCDVDVSGLLASFTDGDDKVLQFPPKTSRFALGGCFVNEHTEREMETIETETAEAPTLEAAKEQQQPTMPPAIEAANGGKPVSMERSRSKRNSSNSNTNNDSSAVGTTTLNGVAAAVTVDVAVETPPVAAVAALAPPKLDRINVQRTTKWLAYVAQLIRLAGAIATLSHEQATTTAAAAAAAVAGASSPSSTVDSAAHVKNESSSDVAAAAHTMRVTETTPAAQTPADTTAAQVPASVQSDETAAEAIVTMHDAPAAAEPAPVAIPTTLQTTDAAPQAAIAANTSPPNKLLQLTQTLDAYFTEVIQLVRPWDAYALSRLELARAYLRDRSGPAVAVLRMLTVEYTRYLFLKHTRAAEKAAAEKRRRRDEQDAQAVQDSARKREAAHESQLHGMRQKKRKV